MIYLQDSSRGVGNPFCRHARNQPWGGVPPHSVPPLGGGDLSWQAVTWVLEQSEAELGSRLVMLSIASHANREGLSAFPSLDTITRETLMSRREVIYCIQAMEEKGELHVDRGCGRGNPSHYSLPFVRSWLEKVESYPKKERVQSLHPLAKLKGAPRSRKGAICNTKGCNDLDVKPEESNTSPLQPLGTVKDITVKSLADSLSMPRTVKNQTELRRERDRQIAEMKAKGYLQ